MTEVDYVDADLRWQMPGLQSLVLDSRLRIDRARGSWLHCDDGSRVLDLFNGVGACAIGHGHPHLEASLKREMARGMLAGTHFSRVRAEYLERLAPLLPIHDPVVQMYSTGAEAVEAALRLVRTATGRQQVVSTWGGFHGKTSAALALHGGPRRGGWGPFPPGVIHVPFAEEGTAPVPGTGGVDEVEACLAFARRAIDASADGPVAAVFVEPVQGTSGNRAPAPGYLQGLRRLADDLGALLVCDEVITGFGRTGSLFASEEDGVRPDVVVLGKAMGSGFPVSALVASRDVVEGTRFAEPSTGSSTYGGNAFAAAAALATLEVILDEDLVGNCRRQAVSWHERLAAWRTTYPIVADTRQRGLMVGVSLCQSETAAAAPAVELAYRLLREQRVLAMASGRDLRLYPSLAMTDEETRQALDRIEDALATTFEQAS